VITPEQVWAWLGQYWYVIVLIAFLLFLFLKERVKLWLWNRKHSNLDNKVYNNLSAGDYKGWDDTNKMFEEIDSRIRSVENPQFQIFELEKLLSKMVDKINEFDAKTKLLMESRQHLVDKYNELYNRIQKLKGFTQVIR
jgi:hypothetical protein